MGNAHTVPHQSSPTHIFTTLHPPFVREQNDSLQQTPQKTTH